MAENFVNIIREIRGSTNDPATDTSCIYGDMKSMHEEYKGFKQITDEERLKLENIEEGATKNSSDAFLLARENHTGNMSIANVQDTPSRMAMTIHEKNKLEAIPQNATENDTDANLRNRATHTGTQSIDTITDTSTHVKMSVDERSKLSGIATGATKNATDAELRSRSTHTGTQSADSIVDGLVNAAYTLQEKNKLSVLSTTVPPAHTHDNTSIVNLNYNKLTGVPESFNPSEHLHSMDEITTGNLDATRINQTNSLQFVNNVERERLAISETTDKKGVPFGYVPLDGNGKINPSYLDALNVIDVFTPINQEAMLLLTSAKPGDIAYVQDSQNTYMLVALPVHLQDNWKQMNSGSGVMTFNGLNGVVNIGTDEIPEGSANVYFTNERVDDRVANLLTPGANVSIVYNDDTNQIIISANDTSVEWSEIQNKPNTKIDVNLSGDISGSGSVVLSKLGNGTLNIENMTLENVGTAGTYRSVTTDIHGRVISGESATTIAEYEITDAYTKTEVENLFVGVSGDQTIYGIKTFSSAIAGNITGNSATATTLKGLTATVDELNYVDGVTSNIQTQLAGKLDTTATASAATKLATARTINGVSFDGTANIVAPTNLGITAGTTAGPIVTSSSGTNATLPSASATASGVVTTEAQTFAGVKTFTSSPIVPTPTTGNQAVNKEYVDNNSFNHTPTITGTVSFNSTTNNINLTNIVTSLGLEIGDVIQISGADDAKNNSEFTIEVITDANNIIVNQGHANKGTTKNVATRASDPDVTVKLLAKYYNAPPSLGRDYVNMAVSRANGTNYSNNTKREMIVSAEIGNANTQGCQALVDGKRISYIINTQSTVNATVTFTVPAGSVYLASNNGIGGTTVSAWYELR